MCDAIIANGGVKNCQKRCKTFVMMDASNTHYCRMLLTRHYDQRPFDETVCDALITNGDVKKVKKGAKRLRWRMHQTRFRF